MSDLSVTATAAEEEGTRFPDLPEDAKLDAEVVSITKKKKPFKDDDGNDIWKFEWKFLVNDPGGEQDGRKLYGDTGLKLSMHPNCRLTAWAQEALQTEITEGMDVDLTLCIGRQVKVIVDRKEYTDKKAVPDPTTGERPTRVANRVVTIGRIPNSNGAAGAVTPGFNPDEEPF